MSTSTKTMEVEPEDQQYDENDNILPPATGASVVPSTAVIKGPRVGMLDVGKWLAKLSLAGTALL
jgi:hypothetical protein